MTTAAVFVIMTIASGIKPKKEKPHQAASKYGEMSERFMELVLKTSDTERYRGFESLSLRHIVYLFIRRCTQVGRRGAPAKGVGRVTGARVQISPSPPKRDKLVLEASLSLFYPPIG